MLDGIPSRTAKKDGTVEWHSESWNLTTNFVQLTMRSPLDWAIHINEDHELKS